MNLKSVFIFQYNCHSITFMSNQYLIIYRFNSLYLILKELEFELGFNIAEVDNKVSLEKSVKNLNNYLVITQNKISDIKYQFIFNFLSIKILKLVEKINIEFMKNNFVNQSNININNYVLNLNSRELLKNKIKIKLTEKEVNSIIYLSNKKGPVSVDQLEKNVWQYQSNIDTHTVETHIYRLRKKILNNFNDSNFIISGKNGYQIK